MTFPSIKKGSLLLGLLASQMTSASSVSARQENICEGNADTDEGKAAVWNDFGVGLEIDGFVAERGAADWVRQIDMALTGNDQSQFVCNTIGGSCPFPIPCQEYRNRGIGQLYWILTAIRNHFDLLNAMDTAVTQEVVDEILNMPGYEDRFGNSADGSNVLAKVASAMVTAAGVTAAIPHISGPLTIAVGIVNSIVANSVQTPDPTLPMADQLGDSFEAMRETIARTLRTATGDLSDEGADPEQLPNQSGNWQTHIAKYFDSGKFLIANPSSLVNEFRADFEKNTRRAMITALTKSQGYFVFVDTDVEEAGCTESPRFWTIHGCADLWIFRDSEIIEADGAQSETVGALMDPAYGGFDVGAAYESAINCALAHPDGSGEVDLTRLPTDGATPECFFNWPVIVGQSYWIGPLRRWALCPDEENTVNTSGRERSGACDLA